MFNWIILKSALRALFSTIPSRLRNGPLFPGWSFRFEMITRVLKFNAATLRSFDWPKRQRIQEQGGDQQARPLRKTCSRENAVVGGIPGEWFTPRTPLGGTLFYLHGGSFLQGSSRTHAEMIMRFATAAKMRAFAPNYRLAPEHLFPAQLHDAVAAYDGLLASGINPNELVIAGDSSGGTLSLLLLMALRDAGKPLPRAALLLSPWVNLAAEGGSLVSNSRYDWAEPEEFQEWAEAILPPGVSPSAPEVSPQFASLKGLPPLRIEVGTAEMLVDQVRAFAEKARQEVARTEFVELPGMVHNSYFLAGMFPECQRAIDEGARWLQRQLVQTAPTK